MTPSEQEQSDIRRELRLIYTDPMVWTIFAVGMATWVVSKSHLFGGVIVSVLSVVYLLQENHHED